METRYITIDELAEYSGIDLREALGSDEAAKAFILRREVRLEAFLQARMHQNIERRWPEFTDYQKLHYKYALLEQCIYIYRVGEIDIDPGYEPDRGETADERTLIERAVARTAKNELILAGVWSYKLQKSNPFGEGFGWLL